MASEVCPAMRVPPKWRDNEAPMAQAALWVWLGAGGPWKYRGDGGINIEMPNGSVVVASPGDWIVRDPDGTLRVLKEKP